MNLQQDLKRYKILIEEELKKVFPKDNIPQEIILESMEYSLLAGGKRLRPILLLKSCELVNGNVQEAIPFAIAMEMIHTYSLIHDDLPAMDDDDYRRGNLTNHKVYGDGLAILAGDGLLNYAYEIMLKTVIENKYSNKFIDAMNEIANSAGFNGMIGGQVVDIISENKEISPKILDFIHLNKTSALIEASLVAGGIIGEANSQEIQLLRDYGKYIGVSFQIRDDILDIVGDQKILGKDIGSDIDKEKSTYVSIHGMDKSIIDLETYRDKAIKIMSKFDKNKATFFVELADYLTVRDN
ncbi:polyprenyl synthetase family protein [Clostridium sp. D2Q-11]|uniref:Farnesyl diphosphate synthase n=1 Tax=Anaeromonas frigoriresistens TaxID=2683708 RepID=A0A942V2L3_9FIRM|nr:farnesyl diphosphate synthase [Anaeromonas frigoriresistens]MBS4539982.1 polyprenyl synthetase family protein [Anaeromonas frigoriresistens]